MATTGPLRPDDTSPPDDVVASSSFADSTVPDHLMAAPVATRSIGFFGRAFESLGNRHYRFLWLGVMTGMSGTQMQFLARGILAYDITNSFTITGLIAVGFAPASLFGSLVGGTVAERVERRTLIQILQLWQVIIAVSVSVMIFTDVLTWQYLLLASMIQGLYFAFMMPARQLMIQKTVGKELMSNAVSLNSAAMSLTTMVAPAIGGVLYGFIGPEGVYLVVAGLNVVAILFMTQLPRFEPDPDAPRRSVAANVIEGFSYVRKYRELLSVLLFAAVVMLLTMPFRMLLPAFAKDVYGATPFQVGALTAMTGIGSLLGALGMASLRKGQRRGLVLMGSAFVSAIAMASVAGLPSYWVGLFLMLFIGMGEAGRFALGQALAMELSDDGHRARVASIFEMIFGFMPFGILSVATAMELFGAEVAIFGLGIVLLITASIFAIRFTKLRNLG
ncbi:MAG TPA: MFS transporter [Dehalococcoidia bacterium]|jgi:MFS family permease|nr:MFS transporter [Dehalococcoidia bacterium]MDP6272577.1 MFS transporter [Dehalococcoidia bacterium]MDP7160047.1 MFS transporter [Dehalococcoidia bacterium]MDP7212335.1 MFS transporter [Dehalococcoidia bacterium]MDP7513868.1 MFS transporter [Dehalococcoidia bacterium]|tara:strand:+ start:1488 stop:2828 length:1341 start_codon:yes stop_codon:yes gene_type:complete